MDWEATYKGMKIWKEPYVISGEFAFYLYDTYGLPPEVVIKHLN